MTHNAAPARRYAPLKSTCRDIVELGEEEYFIANVRQEFGPNATLYDRDGITEVEVPIAAEAGFVVHLFRLTASFRTSESADSLRSSRIVLLAWQKVGERGPSTKEATQVG